MRRRLVATALVASLTLASASRAPARADGLTNGWYGWQLMGTDLAAFGTAAVASRAEHPDKAALLAVGLFFVAPPIIHLAHGRGKGALVSLGLRAPWPLALAIEDTGHYKQYAWLMILGGCGVILDWTFNASEPDDDAPTARLAAPRAHGASLSFSF